MERAAPLQAKGPMIRQGSQKGLAQESDLKRRKETDGRRNRKSLSGKLASSLSRISDSGKKGRPAGDSGNPTAV
jgi:hypothetical protein